MSKSERTRRDKPERTINTLPSEEPLDANFLRRLATAYVIVPGVQKRLLAIADRLDAELRIPETPVDENGCHTLENGDCISEGPCIHTPRGERKPAEEFMDTEEVMDTAAEMYPHLGG